MSVLTRLFRLGAACLAACHLFAVAAAAAAPDFTVTELGRGTPVVLVVGGIQGDEPGGFSAAALLATRYRFSQGTLRIVPNLNFPAIIQRSRGLHGDMNRKFAALSPQDPEYATVRRIQALITEPDVDIILNLHDGSGFYRPTRESAMRNPDRWGQSVIIDQAVCPGVRFGQLETLAQNVTADANRHLLDAEHALHVKNTHTGEGDAEMAKSLTWFALSHGKAAFGLEVSKNFGVAHRAYYHLRMVESFLDRTGVEFERDFPLTPEGITRTLGSDVYVGFVNNRVVLPLDNARPMQAGSLPLPRGAENAISSSMPIVAVTTGKNVLQVHYGNNTVTSFRPDWLDTDDGLASVTVEVDGQPREVRFGDMIHAADSFRVASVPGYRVNAIGANKGRDESDITLRRRDFMPRYSVDKAGTTFRVEVYKDKLYAGTFMVRFGAPAVAVTTPLPPTLPAVKGKESDLGW